MLHSIAKATLMLFVSTMLLTVPVSSGHATPALWQLSQPL